MEDGTIPRDILYGELATGTKPTGRPAFTSRLKRRGGNINPAGWEAVAADRRHWRLDDKAGIQAGEERRAEQRDEKRER